VGCSRRVLLLAAQPTAAGTPAGGAPGGTEGGAPDGAASGREAVKLARQMEALSMEVGKSILNIRYILGSCFCKEWTWWVGTSELDAQMSGIKFKWAWWNSTTCLSKTVFRNIEWLLALLDFLLHKNYRNRYTFTLLWNENFFSLIRSKCT